MDGSIVFVTWRQCAPSSNTCFLGLWALMCQRNHVLDWVQILMGRGNIGGKGRPLESIRTVCRELCKNVWSDRDAVCDAESSGPKEPLDGGQIPHGKGQFWEEGHAPTIPWRELCRNGWTDHLHRVSKNVPPLACYNFDACERILIFFLAGMLPIKQAIKRHFTMPHQLTCASALPVKTGKRENCIFPQMLC